MSQRWSVTSVVAMLLAVAAPAFAAPLTLDRHERKVEKVAPPLGTLPGRTLCVCQHANDPRQTFTGYLASFRTTDATSRQTVNIVCSYVFTNAVGVLDFSFCSIFQVIK